MLWITVVSMKSEMMRDESVSSASLMTSNISPVLRDEFAVVVDVLRRLGVDARAGAVFPVFQAGQALFEFADRGEILIEPLPIGA